MIGRPLTDPKKLEELSQAVKIACWKPFPHQQRILDFLNAGKKVLLLQGANRVGKTVCGACITGAAVYGQQPWDGAPTVWGQRPVRTRIICVDWEHHAKEVVVPKLKEWFPAGTYQTHKNNTGVEAFWEFPNGSTIELMTHIQDTKIHEGWSGDFVWSDEPLPRDKYVANRRGLIDTSGVFLMTMTAIYEPWIMDEIALANEPHVGCVCEVPMTANAILRQEDIMAYEKDVPEEEREARIRGGWFQLAGKVVKGFSEKNVVPFFKVPVDWPVIAVIDLHLNIPQAVGFYAWDKYDRIFVVDEIWENCGPEALADEIIRRKTTNTWRMIDAYIDPLAKGDSKYVKNRFDIEDSFSIMERKLRAYGINLSVGSKDKASGVRNINDRITGANGVPTILFLQGQTKRHIYEIQRWVYDDNGDPMKQNDHMMENLYRATLTSTKYVNPSKYANKLKYRETGVV